MRLSPLLLILALTSQLPPRASSTYGAFAFPNPAGTEVIVTHNVPNAERLRTAVCSKDVKQVSFARLQKGTGADRDDSAQFAKLTGSVFTVTNGGADPQDACLLAPESVLEGARLIRPQGSGEPASCSAADRQRFQNMRERRLQACWSLATVHPRGSIVAVEWLRAGADALASVIVEVEGRTMAIDLPARFNRGGEDLWRADDGGRFGGGGISIPFLIQRGNIFTIPMRWNGAEGSSLSLFVSEEAGTKTHQVIADAWYRAARVPN